MKRITFTMLLLTVLFAAKAQYFPIDTARLNSAYRAIISGERNIKTEMEFLESYPTTWLEFYMHCSALLYQWESTGLLQQIAL